MEINIIAIWIFGHIPPISCWAFSSEDKHLSSDKTNKTVTLKLIFYAHILTMLMVVITQVTAGWFLLLESFRKVISETVKFHCGPSKRENWKDLFLAIPFVSPSGIISAAALDFFNIEISIEIVNQTEKEERTGKKRTYCFSCHSKPCIFIQGKKDVFFLSSISCWLWKTNWEPTEYRGILMFIITILFKCN